MKPLPGTNASVPRRIVSLAYEVLPLFALLFFAAMLYRGTASASLEGWNRHLFQLYEWLVAGIYLIVCWSRGGQTLPMKAWKLRLVTIETGPVPPGLAAARYCLATISAAIFGVGFLWAFLDRDRQFLHDRLCGTRFVNCP